ncbi:hypothetical protein ABIB49_000934 [Arthrobacter sp. UYCu512]|uniref:hypothetical protein n=1 Tax=Arthrobacter sp. UYCu512 TaxID=3156338 RepID=UPI003393D7BD
MNSLFFWIIVLSFLVPMAMRYYKKSVRGRNRNQGMPGGLPDRFGNFPGAGPGPGPRPGQQGNPPRDGFTQRDYYGGFGQLGAPQPPAKQDYRAPYEDSPEYLNHPPQQQWQPPAPIPTPEPTPEPTPQPPAAPQGFRARKLADLDQRYSDGELSMEDYMAQRAEIMKG